MNSSDAPGSSVWDSAAVFKFVMQLLALGLLLVFCYVIFEPFLTPVVWGIVLAVTLAPLHTTLARKMGGRFGLSATLISVVLLLILLVPALWLLLASAGEMRELGQAYRSGDLHLPPPDVRVKDWPLVGEPLYANWTKASENLTGLIREHQEQVRSAVTFLLGLLANTARSIGIFALAVLAAGILLAYGKSAEKLASALFVRLGGPQGEGLADIAKRTIRSVVKGILGVSFIQSAFVGVGITIAGIPFAGLWIVICLILSIVQIGILPVAIGVIVYIWSTGSTLTAVLLTIWMVIASVIDNILKPILLGKGAPVPMIVVFIGAIGGFLHSGLVGLFTGSVLLSLGYKLVEAWLREPSETDEAPNVESGVAGM